MTRAASFLTLPLLTTAMLLTGCHNGNDNSNSTPQRGQLLATPSVVSSYSNTELLNLLTGSTFGTELLDLISTPTCGITIYHFEYETVGGANEATTASGAWDADAAAVLRPHRLPSRVITQG